MIDGVTKAHSDYKAKTIENKLVLEGKKLEFQFSASLRNTVDVENKIIVW